MNDESKSKFDQNQILNNDVAFNGRVLDKNGVEIKDVHWHDKILGAREVMISLYDIAQNELNIKCLQSFIRDIEELTQAKDLDF